MESINEKKEKYSHDRINTKENSKEKDLFLTRKGKLFEQYVASFISRELGEKTYKIGMKFSLSKEIDRLLNCVESKDESVKEILNKKITEYQKSCPKEIQSLSSSSDGESSINSKKNKFHVKGHFDIIIPNIERGKFEKMLENNFQKNGNTKFIVGTEKEIPERFNLFAEVGLNVFNNEYKKKKEQIKKYNYILNFGKIIQDTEIYKKYKKEFDNEYYYEKNIDVDIFPDECVYLIVSNSTYAEFTHRFLDYKNYKDDKKEKKMGELNDLLLPKDSNSNIYCAFINFDNGINMSLIEKFESEKKIKELESNNKKMGKKIEKLETKLIEMKNENNQEIEKMKKENNNLRQQIQMILANYDKLSQRFNEMSQKCSEDKIK